VERVKNKNKNIFVKIFSKIKTKIRFFNRRKVAIIDGIYAKYMSPYDTLCAFTRRTVLG
jgi:hypothetical protein